MTAGLRGTIVFDDARVVNFVSLPPAEKELVRVWRNDERIRRWMYTSRLITPEEHARFIERLAGDDANYYWLVSTPAGIPAGVVYLNRVDRTAGTAFLGIYADPDGGVPRAGSLLMRCLRRLAFGCLGLGRLRLEVLEANGRATAFYLREGFTVEERLTDGEHQGPVIVMGITEDRDHAL